MTEFSTKSMLEVEVDQRSLKDARAEVQDRVGSVRVGAVTDGGTSGGGSIGASGAGREGSRIRNLLAIQVEQLSDIEEKIERLGATQGGGEGGGAGSTVLQLKGLQSILGGSGGLKKAGGALASALGSGSTLGLPPMSTLQNLDKQFTAPGPLKQIDRGVGGDRPGGPAGMDAFDPSVIQNQTQEALNNIEPPTLLQTDQLQSGLNELEVPQIDVPGQEALNSLSKNLPQIGFDKPDWVPKLPGFGDDGPPAGTPGSETSDEALMNPGFGDEKPSDESLPNPGFGDGESSQQGSPFPVDLGINVDVPTKDLQRQIETAVDNELRNFDLEGEVIESVRRHFGL